MHEKFLNRESRQEDIEIIESLKKLIEERDELLRRLQVILLKTVFFFC